MRNLILGVDPGLKGAAAVYSPSERRLIEVINFKDRPIREIFLALQGFAPLIHFAMVESQHSRSYQSSQSTFTAGHSFGLIVACIGILQINSVPIAPSAWKAVMKLSKDKKLSLAKASELFPDSKFASHDCAEAALLAVFGGLYFSDIFKAG